MEESEAGRRTEKQGEKRRSREKMGVEERREKKDE